MSEELRNYFDICFPIESGKTALSITVNEFYNTEHTDFKMESGYATVVFDSIVKVEGIDYILGNYFSVVKGNAIDVKSGHE
ncbi:MULTISPECIES: hypothetical protein [Flavobacterium]|uniref:hypothetical protein n=1 Tax=Flavobacterium TaxID=237 RepID=UPI0022AC173B|nr:MULTISPECIES: hypothetical protein [Flavobacterium]